MTEKEYRKSDGISRSELWRLRESPEKFRWYQEHPEPSTPTLVFGAAVHKMLLEPATMKDEFSVAPDGLKRTAKKGWAEYCETVPGKAVITQDEFAQAVDMANSALNAPFVKKLLDGEHEKPFYWVDDLTGEGCKIRLDCLTEINGELLIVDYKTAQDASIDGFSRHALKYGYDFQSGMYSEGVEATTGKKPRFVFVVQEKEPPFAINVIEADAAFIQRGKDKFRELIGIYHECKLTDNWYGYMGAEPVIHQMQLPSWAGGEPKN